MGIGELYSVVLVGLTQSWVDLASNQSVPNQTTGISIGDRNLESRISESVLYYVCVLYKNKWFNMSEISMQVYM